MASGDVVRRADFSFRQAAETGQARCCRSPRRAPISTARSGMMMRNVAPMVPSTRRISPPCARTSSAAIARPRPEPPGRVEPWNASNRCARAFSRHAGPGVGHLDHHHGALAPAGDAQLVAAGIVRRAAFQRLQRVAREVEDRRGTAGPDRHRRAGRARPRRPSAPATPGRGRASRAPPRPAPRAAPAGGRAAARAPGRRRASTGRTRWRARASASACGAKRCTFGSGTLTSRSENSCAEASRLRRSWLIFDTARPSAARWLFCCSIEARSRCIAPSSRSAMPISSLRGRTARRCAPGFSGSSRNATMLVVSRSSGPHEQIVQREIDQRRGDRRDDQREQQDVAREAEHRLRAAALPRSRSRRSRRPSAPGRPRA